MNRSTHDTVRQFLDVVRSGAAPERAGEFLAPTVFAHQVRAPEGSVIQRDPQDYAEHVREMTEQFGAFSFVVDELIVDGVKAYARWTQHGTHSGEIEGFSPTGRLITTIGSAVYRVERGLIAEYWIQQDAAGLMAQLQAGA